MSRFKLLPDSDNPESFILIEEAPDIKAPPEAIDIGSSLYQAAKANPGGYYFDGATIKPKSNEG